MRRAISAGLLIVALWSSTASACPTCSTGVGQSPEGGARLGAGYNASVLLMIAVPFTLLGVGGALLARAVRRGEIEL